MAEKRVLAIDFGASSGRVMLGGFDGKIIRIEEIHRFSNDPVRLGSTMYWDFLRLFYEMKRGMRKARSYGKADSIGVDTWGVDFGLLDQKGHLLENPVHYRDERTAGMIERSLQMIERDRFYQITGNQFMEINTVFQLLSMTESRKATIGMADSLLMMPDLFNYYLSGVKACDHSMASTTQMMDAREKRWSKTVIDELGLPGQLLPQLVPCGTKLGPLKKELCAELGMDPMENVAVAGHDTQCALAAVPAKEKDFIFISCGTWSLFGTELESPLINEYSNEWNITNECGCEGKTSFLKNIIGLWLIQESRRQWMREGREYSFGSLEKMAQKAKPFAAWIDPDAPEFVPAGNIPERIQSFCKRKGQYIPQTEAEIVRCIDESLALKYRAAYEEISRCTGKKYQAVYMIGGGTQSALLCQMTANACGCPVIAGPAEATIYGNAAIQLMAAGELKNLQEIRNVIRNSVNPVVYEPENQEEWKQAYEKFCAIIA